MVCSRQKLDDNLKKYRRERLIFNAIVNKIFGKNKEINGSFWFSYKDYIIYLGLKPPGNLSITPYILLTCIEKDRVNIIDKLKDIRNPIEKIKKLCKALKRVKIEIISSTEKRKIIKEARNIFKVISKIDGRWN